MQYRRMAIRSRAKKTGQDQTSVAVKWAKYLATQKRKAAKGGKARAAKLSKKKLSEQGRKAVQARWARYRAEQNSKGSTK